ncbi:hypothetical protein M9458_032257, partial [Cirrhinus mrigala]
LTVDIADDNTSPTLDPEPSPPSQRCTEPKPEPTTDGEPIPATIKEPSPMRATELKIVLEPEPVCEPATKPATEEITEGSESTEEDPAHCTTAEDVCPELSARPILTMEVNPLSASQCALTESPDSHKIPPTLPLLPPPPLFSGSPSTHPQPTICVVESTQVCQSPSMSWLEDPLSPAPASESWTPPWPIDPAASQRLLAPASLPWPISPPALPAPSSLQLRLGQLSTICRLGTLLRLHLVPLSLRLCQAPPTLPLHLGPLLLRLNRSLADPHLCL